MSLTRTLCTQARSMPRAGSSCQGNGTSCRASEVMSYSLRRHAVEIAPGCPPLLSRTRLQKAVMRAMEVMSLTSWLADHAEKMSTDRSSAPMPAKVLRRLGAACALVRVVLPISRRSSHAARASGTPIMRFLSVGPVTEIMESTRSWQYSLSPSAKLWQCMASSRADACVMVSCCVHGMKACVTGCVLVCATFIDDGGVSFLPRLCARRCGCAFVVLCTQHAPPLFGTCLASEGWNFVEAVRRACVYQA